MTSKVCRFRQTFFYVSFRWFDDGQIISPQKAHQPKLRRREAKWSHTASKSLLKVTSRSYNDTLGFGSMVHTAETPDKK